MRDWDVSSKRVEHVFRLFIPQLLLVVFLLFEYITLPFAAAKYVEPQLVLAGIYYWALYRPSALPKIFCFILGLVMDVLSGAPLGLNALVFVLVQWLVSDQRRFLAGQPYITIWAGFALVVAVSSLLQWFLYGLPYMQWPGLGSFLIKDFITITLFPFITLLLVYVHRLLPVATHGYD